MACPYLGRRDLLAKGIEIRDPKNFNVTYDKYIESEEIIEEILEEQLLGDSCPLLVLRRSCFSSKVIDDSWLRTSLFQSTCIVNGKVCRFIVDLGSCENIVSKEVIQKLTLNS